MAHLEMNQKYYRLVYFNSGKRIRIPLNTDDWHTAVYRTYFYHNTILEGKTASEVFFQIFPILEARLKENTQKSYLLYWKKFASRFSKVDISKITARDLCIWKNELMNQVGITSVSITLRSVQSVFSLFYKHKIISYNPFHDLDRFIPKPAHRSDYLKSDECTQLLLAAQDNLLAQGYLKLLLTTGMRRGELYNLKWVDIGDLFMFLEGKTGKRKFPLWTQVKESLDQIKANTPVENEYVMVTLEDYSHPFEPSYIGRIVRRYVKKAGLRSSISTHSLRHTFGTHMVRLIGIRHTQKLMGHSRIETTCRYENECVTEIEEVMYF